MASPAWLPQDVQSSTSQASVSGSIAGGPSMGPSTPTATPDPVVGAPTSKGASGTSSDSIQGSSKAKFDTPGYVVPPSSFSYNVRSDVNATSGSSQQSSSSPIIKSNSPGSLAFLQPPVPGLSASASPSFSYNISHSGVGFPSGQQFQSRMPIPPGHFQGGKNGQSPAASLQPPVPGQSARPSLFVPGAVAQIMPPPMLSPIGFPKGASTHAANFSFNGNPQSMQKDQSLKSQNTTAEVAHETSSIVSSAPSGPHSVSQPVHTTSTTLWMPTAPSFQVPPGIALSVPLSSTSVNSSAAITRPIMPSNPALQQQTYPSCPSVPLPTATASQGLWLPRPPLLSYPAAFPVPFPMPMTHSMPLPSIPLPDSQPPGVTPMGPPAGTPTFSAAIGSGIQPELPPGIDNSKHVADVCIKDGAAVSEQLDTWTAHKAETGAIYYYNALSGESTYEKPAGFKGEPDKVTAQPTPVSWEKLGSTDWALVTTNDGKRYYYNTKSKLSSWQIPIEVTELRKKHDGDDLKEQSLSVPNTNIFTEKGPDPISLSAPAVNTGGRDATALRTSVVPGSSSALDMIKKKLQDSGAPATSSPLPALSSVATLDLNGSRAIEAVVKGPQSESSKDKLKDANGDGNLSDSSSDSEDVDSGPTKEECIIQFKEMLKERGVAPFSKWEKELPKIVFDPRFKAIPGYNARRALFEHYVRTRAEEERKEKRAAQKAAIEGFKQLLEEAKEDINYDTDYHTFKRKWGSDPRFEALERKEREILLNERVLPLKRAAQEKAQAVRAAAASSFKSMLIDRGDITTISRWSKVKDSLRNDLRYKSVKHEDREALFNEYISELKSTDEEAERVAKSKWEEEERLKERERALRKRKEREEQEVERVRSKARKKEAVESYQALLVETIKDPQVYWTESKSKLERDPQGRAANPYLDQSDLEKLFREHVKILHERCAHKFRVLLAESITAEAAGAGEEKEDGKTVLTSWSTAKRILKGDPRYAKMPRKDRESLWRRHVEDIHRQVTSRSSVDSGKYFSGSKRNHERR